MKIKIGKYKGYFSPSQINSFIERRDQYIRNYVLGAKWPGNASFSRGTAIEYGLDLAIKGVPDTQAAEAAWDKYIEECVDNRLSDKETSKFDHDHIFKMTLTGIRYYVNELGASPAVESQVKMVANIDGLKTKLMGYADFVFPKPGNPFHTDHGIRDLKTAAKSPSKDKNTGKYKLSSSYARQGVVYHIASGRRVSFDYIVANKEPKVVTIPVDDELIAETIPVIKAAGRAMETFWETVPDEDDFSEAHKKAFIAMAFPALDSIWNADEKRDVLKDFIELCEEL